MNDTIVSEIHGNFRFMAFVIASLGVNRLSGFRAVSEANSAPF